MNFREYQKKAKATDQFKDKERSLSSSMWNLNETVGLVSRLYDERGRLQRDSKAFKEQLGRKLGDILWYVSNITDCQGLNLETIARENLIKCKQRWGKKKRGIALFDDEYPPDQQFPRKTTFTIIQDPRGKVRMGLELKDGGHMQLGARVTDNAYFTDGYRFHDVIHLSFMAVLGWSPVIRTLLQRKRKNNDQVDEVEDGARATNLEESVSAIIYEHARTVDYFKKDLYVPFELLKWIEKITRHLEVSKVTYDLWNDAIIQGYAAWREINKNKGGLIDVDLRNRTIKYREAK